MGCLLSTTTKHSLENGCAVILSDRLHPMFSMDDMNQLSGGQCHVQLISFSPLLFCYRSVCAYTRACPQCILRSPPQNNPTRPANPPEHGRRAGNGTKTPGNEFSGTTLGYKKVPTGRESNKTIKREVGLICAEPSESGLVTVQRGVLN